MPKSVWTFVVSASVFLILMIIMNIAMVQSTGKIPVFNWIVWILLIIGIIRKNRIIRYLAIIFTLLSMIGIAAAIFVPVLTAENPQVNVAALLLITVLGLAPLITAFISLFRRSMKAYVGLICPKCGSASVKAQKIFGPKMVCKDCSEMW